MPRRSSPLASDDDIPLYRGNIDEDLNIVSRNSLAETITGGLSYPSKMPGPAWGISATRCRVGSVLAEKDGSICSECYAMKGRYSFGNVQAKMERRYDGLRNILWTPAMVFLIRYFCDRYFRWMDSGDVQGENHFRNICKIATAVPEVSFWMPTKELAVVRSWKDEIPENLIVRVSGAMIDGPPPPAWPTTSTVFTDESRDGSIECEAKKRGNKCGACRACWDPGVQNVAYPFDDSASAEKKRNFETRFRGEIEGSSIL